MVALETNDNLPLWSNCEAAVDEKRATALEQFIYDYEPGVSSGARKWRRQLAAVVQEASHPTESNHGT